MYMFSIVLFRNIVLSWINDWTAVSLIPKCTSCTPLTETLYSLNHKKHILQRMLNGHALNACSLGLQVVSRNHHLRETLFIIIIIFIVAKLLLKCHPEHLWRMKDEQTGKVRKRLLTSNAGITFAKKSANGVDDIHSWRCKQWQLFLFRPFLSFLFSFFQLI